MGDRRNGPYALRTPKEAKRDLTVPLYAILKGRAVPIFSGTSLAGPSRKVGIFPTPGGGSCGGKGVSHAFPVWVDPDQWERAVIPVLMDERFDPGIPVNQWKLFSMGEAYLAELGEAIEASFISAGYGPSPPA